MIKKNKQKNILLIKKMVIKNCKLKFHPYDLDETCYLYDFEKLGITEKELAKSFEGCHLRVYKNNMLSLSRSIRKCIYCKELVTDMKSHLVIHNKKEKDFIIAKFQLDLYKKLLDLIRSKNVIFAFAFTTRNCDLCVDKVHKNRVGLCVIPESSRNKVRSLKMLGFSCDDFDDNWIQNAYYGFIIHKAPKG